jgi:hypothetical protein
MLDIFLLFCWFCTSTRTWKLCCGIYAGFTEAQWSCSTWCSIRRSQSEKPVMLIFSL